MKSTIELGTRAWSAAGSLTWDFATIDDEVGADILSVSCAILECRLNVTTGAGGGVTGRELMEWLQAILIHGGPFIDPWVTSVNGYDLVTYLRVCEGLTNSIPGDLAAEQQDVDKDFIVIIPTCSQLHERPEEHYPAANAMARQNFKLTLGAAAVNDDTTMNSASFTLSMKLHRGNTVRLAHYRCIESYDKELREQLPASTYHGICWVAPSDSFAAADITNVRVIADGLFIHQSLEPDSVLYSYMDDITYGQSFDDGAGTSFANGGGDWDEEYASVTAFPLIWLSADFRNNRTSQLPGSEDGLLVDCDGGATTMRYVVGRVPILKSTFAQTQLRQMGADPSSVTVSRDVTPAQIARRKSLHAVPYVVKGTSNPARAGKISHAVAPRNPFQGVKLI